MGWVDDAQGQDGVISRRRLRGHGVSDAAVTRLVGSGALVRIRHGVHLVRGAPFTYRARLWCAVVSTDGVLGFGTAAHLWGVEGADPPPRIDVVIAPGRRVSTSPSERLHRVFVPASCVQRLDGLPVTTRRWTLLDHLGRLNRAQAHRLADRALQRGWLRAEDIERRLRDHPCRTGNTMLRTIAAHCADGAAAESERVLHRLLRRGAITGWVPNMPLWIDGELAAVLDVGMPARRLAIEIDGWAFHSDVDRFQGDRHRQNALVSAGWTVLRFTWADLVERPGYVLATIRGHAA